MKKMFVKLMIVVFCAVVWPGLVLAALSDQTSPTAPGHVAPAGDPSKGDSPTGGPPAGGPPRGPWGDDPDFAKYAKIDELGIKGLDMKFPPIAMTLIGDAGGVRSKLAEYGIGFLGYSLNAGIYDFRNNDTPGANYNGRRASYFMGSQGLFLTYDTGKIGLKGGQLQMVLNANTNGNNDINPQKSLNISQLAYYQPFNDDMFEFKVGYLTLAYDFMNVNVAGSFASGTLGPAASLIGQSRASFPGIGTPGFEFRYNAPNHFYNKIGVVRSLPSGTPDTYYDNIDFGLRFDAPGARALIIDEFGYNRPAAQNEKAILFRAGGLYNFSKFQNYETSGKSENFGFYGMMDFQLTQPDAFTPRGLYAGGTFNYSPPDRNIFTEYYEARVYGIGLIPGRPFDMVSLVGVYNKISNDARDFFNSLPSAPPGGGGPGLPAAPAASAPMVGHTSALVAAYAAQVYPGVIVQPGLGVRNNPSTSPAVPLTVDGYLMVAIMF